MGVSNFIFIKTFSFLGELYSYYSVIDIYVYKKFE